MVTNGAKKKTSKKVGTAPHPLALLRGAYSRVARELGVDRSYVSRVASGERNSDKIQQALTREMSRIEKLAARHKDNSETSKKNGKKR